MARIVRDKVVFYVRQSQKQKRIPAKVALKETLYIKPGAILAKKEMRQELKRIWEKRRKLREKLMKRLRSP